MRREGGRVCGARRKERRKITVSGGEAEGGGGEGWVKTEETRTLSVDRGCTTTRNGRAYTGERPRFMDFQANSWTRDRTPNNARRCPIDPDSR